MAKYSKGAGKKVERAMHEKKRGELKSGRSGKKVTSRKQAIAIGLSEARERGAKVPQKKSASKSGGRSKSASKKGAAKKGTSKKGASKKAASKGRRTSSGGSRSKGASRKSASSKTASKSRSKASGRSGRSKSASRKR